MKTRNTNQPQSGRGFTLVEIAIALMIIGLLVVGVLRGQELITSARVRNIIDTKTSMQAAMIAFMDRYKMLPGDLTATQAAIVGNGAVGGAPTAGDGIIAPTESVLVFQNLAAAGFITCGNCQSVSGPAIPSTANSPLNAYGDFIVMGTGAGSGGAATGANFWTAGGSVDGTRKFLTTGGGIPSQVLAEVDRKADDGLPGSGTLRWSALGSTGSAGTTTQCTNALLPGNAASLAAAMRATDTAGVVWANPNYELCAGAWLL